MTTALLVVLAVLALCVVSLILRVRALETAIANLARIVDKPRRRDRAIRKEIRELEDELEQMDDDIRSGYLPDEDDFRRGEQIREKLDRRLKALAGRRGSPPEPPPTTPPPS